MFANFVWGVGNEGGKAVDRTRSDPNVPSDVGIPVLDENFDPTSTNAQLHMLNACSEYENNKFIAADPVYENEGGVYCPLNHFKLWLEDMNETFPTSQFTERVGEFVSQPDNATCAANPTQACTSYYKTVTSFPSAFIRGAKLQNAWKSYFRWKCPNHGTNEDDSCGGAGKTLASVMIGMNVSISWDLGAFYSRPVYESLEETANKINQDGGESMQGMQIISDRKYTNMRTEEIMSTSAFIGCTISGLFAFVVLLLATKNLVLSCLSVICIAVIVVNCIGFIVLVGWQLGTMESICITICIGFSVDFVVHIAIAYLEAKEKAGLSIADIRYQKTAQALEELGVSVVAAAVTTAVGSVFMVLAPMIPFAKLGVFIAFDISMSLFVSINLFPLLLVLMGPVKSQGTVRCPCRKSNNNVAPV